ncbi:hypothetical protein PN471_00310 [Aphanizomenon sp. CS-733/32]|uniref:hypothetical protein n=1 Tax=Aphanizomenon sp. CS-733/32 TaxID=3021715 RepID=UPI00232F3AA2|nr:hypothetical protein [Aphanizomenon sp. CS-733/32]MDB9307130.1 hypothetical protein [Aphanizomenon sp. CS-733/32]
MKNTTKAIFSLGLISFLTLGGICQNALAAESTQVGQPGVPTASKPVTSKKPATKKPVAKKPAVKTPTKKPVKK